jgi:DNA replication initiation complex subunit (GINS family)
MKTSTSTQPTAAAVKSVPSMLSSTQYHELSEIPLIEKDLFTELHENIQKLEDVSSRLLFVAREVRSLMKISN